MVLVPLAALAVLTYVVPRWRWAARWPALVLGGLGALSVQFASMTGDTLKDQLHKHSSIIETHETWAGRLQVAMWVLAAVTLVAFLTLPHLTRLRGGQDREARVAMLEKPLTLVLPVLAVVVLVLVFLTGEAGARSVWAG